MTLSYAEETLIRERFDDVMSEMADVFDLINSQLADQTPVKYNTGRIAKVNSHFRATLENMGGKKK